MDVSLILLNVIKVVLSCDERGEKKERNENKRKRKKKNERD